MNYRCLKSFENALLLDLKPFFLFIECIPTLGEAAKVDLYFPYIHQESRLLCQNQIKLDGIFLESFDLPVGKVLMK